MTKFEKDVLLAVEDYIVTEGGYPVVESCQTLARILACSVIFALEREPDIAYANELETIFRETHKLTHSFVHELAEERGVNIDPNRKLREELLKDMKGNQCKECDLGTYQETSIFDDMDGILHCTNCHQEIKRYG